MKDDFIEFELVLETHNAGDCAFIKSIFDAEGIIYFIQGEYVAPYLFNALPMRVMVKKDQAENAQDILKDMKLSYSYDFGENTDDNENN